MRIVPGAGPCPNLVAFVGEAPGAAEADQGAPFVGRSGYELIAYLARHGVTFQHYYRTNVCQEFTPGNPDPTPAQVAEWTPYLISEIRDCAPRLIIAVGRFAMRWFLGDAAELDACHGVPHEAGAFDPALSSRVPQGCVIIPTYHPALGLYDSDARALIDADFAAAAAAIKCVRAGGEVSIRRDAYAGREVYQDLTGAAFAAYVTLAGDAIGVDTEGTLDDQWSIQVSLTSGYGCVLRRSQPDFEAGIRGLQSVLDAADPPLTVVFTNAPYDLAMGRAMGLDFSRCKLWDTMYGAYLPRTEPQGLKAGAWRNCGMRMQSYADTVGEAGLLRQRNYLVGVGWPAWNDVDGWPKPEARLIEENDGTARVYKPQYIGTTARKIVADLDSGKFDKDGNPTDPYARWHNVDAAQRVHVESVLGRMPIGTLADIPLAAAAHYAARDADASLRLYHAQVPRLRADHLDTLMQDGMLLLPVFEEMQSNGMPASRAYFAALYDDLTADMRRFQRQLSAEYFDGQPINPGSSKQVAALLRRRGLRAALRTESGDPSTAKKSIEHLRYTDPAFALVFDWREAQHARDAFCTPVLARIPADWPEPTYPIRCKIKTTRTATRRLATSDPNLLAIPSRKDMGKRIRSGYVCADGEVFVAADFSQIEARFMAHESRDPLLCRFFREGRDIHKETAALIWNMPLDKVTKKERDVAKTANFGIIYGIQGAALLAQLRMQGAEGWTEEKCDALIHSIMHLYSGMSAYIAAVAVQVRREHGVVRDHWGMPRYLPGIYSTDRAVAAEAARHAVSHRIQGGAQGMIQKSMIWLAAEIRTLQRADYNVKWRLQIHDELILTCAEDVAEVVKEIVLEGLINHCGIILRVPVEAEGKIAKSWGELK